MAGKDRARGNRIVPRPRDFGYFSVTATADSEPVFFVEFVATTIVTTRAGDAVFLALAFDDYAVTKMAIVLDGMNQHARGPAFAKVTEQATVILGIVEPFAGNAERDTSRSRHQACGHYECQCE